MRGITRGPWVAVLTAVTVAVGLAGCTGGGHGDKAATSSAPAVPKACANGTFTWSGVKKADRLTGVSAPEHSGGRTIRTTNLIEPVYTPKPVVRTEGPALSSAEILFSLGKKIGEIDSDAATLADVNGDTWAFTDVHQKAPDLHNRLSKVSGPGETVQYAGVREWEGDFRYTCSGGRATTGHARNWTVDMQGVLSCDESVDNRMARQAARLSCGAGSPATRNA
ncbi:hypothetical protein [Streptomyces sp. TLI_185]|uniref:hypothetical protein n=1 Tax=Streptomyces sp. TLI_185 TaxID=2485151 RepID=UPI000FABDEED|nr:hypothetical protein [Streptomyces sp. TLI_185]RPF36007.1 hypothetical protein EDD92_6034 [Streptomyces sp. TLI_185]